jgi:hypothetical protein
MDVNHPRTIPSDLLQEITALKAQQRVLEARLQEAAELNLRVMHSSGDCIKVLDLDGNVSFMSEPGQRLMEVTDFDAIRAARGWGFGPASIGTTQNPLWPPRARARRHYSGATPKPCPEPINYGKSIYPQFLTPQASRKKYCPSRAI